MNNELDTYNTYSRNCNKCGSPIEKNYYLCKNCNPRSNGWGKMTYRRTAIYNISEDTTYIIDEYFRTLSEQKMHLEKDNLIALDSNSIPEIAEGNIPFLPPNEIQGKDYVIRAKQKGIPTYTLFQNNQLYIKHIQIGTYFYFSINGDCGGEYIKNNELIEQFEKIKNYLSPTEKLNKTKSCLLCDNTTISEEHLLCPSCYHIYKNKKLFLELSVNDTSIKILDATYEGRLECDDGHIVKSQAERDIDNYLFEKNIKHGYETILTIYDNGKRIELRPDFCIFDGDEKIYIEYWGIENEPDYEKRKEFKMPLYKKAGITLINMYKRTDMRNIRASLEDKLKHYKKGQINFEE